MTKFWVRLAAVIVFLVMVLLAILSAAGIWAFVENRVYADGGAQLRYEILDKLAGRMDRTVMEYYRDFDSGKDTEWLKDYWNAYLTPEKSNFFFQIRDAGGKILFSSYSAPYQFHSTGEFEDVQEVLTEEQTFDSAAKRQAWLEDFSREYRVWDVEQWDHDADADGRPDSWHVAVIFSEPATLFIERYIAKSFTANDEISLVMGWTDRLIGARNALPWICAASTLLTLAALIFLITVSGRRNADGSVRLAWFDRIPLDLLLVLYLALFGSTMVIAEDVSDWEVLIAAALLIPIWAALGLAFLMSLAARARAGTLWKNNLLYHIVDWFRSAFKWLWGALITLIQNIPLFWKTLLIWAGICLAEFLALASYGHIGTLFLLWFVERLILTPLILFAVVGMQRLRKGAKDISEGDLEQKIDLKYLYGPLRAHGEDLNHITEGLHNAVDERVKSERMKAELITNVSHDIKTPLTNIVNYVDLLNKEPLQSERAKDYIAVLMRQSQRLKKLTEDLVDASKASTGNITVNAAPVDLNVLLSQATGEFSDRFLEKRLETVLATSPEQPKVLADGQLLWRVFSNLMTNIVKYAMPGTRVYLTTAVQSGRATVTFRNISNAALNMTGDELTERFVRGDRSRTGGEGSGLGLSIARSLTELQGGVFTVTVDGDLFKAELDFPVLS